MNLASRKAGVLAALAVLGMLAQGCNYRVLGGREGQFSHGEGGVEIMRLPSPTPSKGLHWDTRDLAQGTITLEYATVQDRVMQYETAWFHNLEVVEVREGGVSIRGCLLAGGICTLTVVLLPVGVILFIAAISEAVDPTWSSPFGHAIPGEYTVRKNVRVVEPEYKALPVPAGSVARISVRPAGSDDPREDHSFDSRTWWPEFDSAGRITVSTSQLIDLAASNGCGLCFRAEFDPVAGESAQSPEFVLSAAEVLKLHEARK
ncbi:MAG: hypothetical protein K8T20_10930 [Planctomycetes bacterium]|nr:hypothetical protein [Planctomycetota bacterium]